MKPQGSKRCKSHIVMVLGPASHPQMHPRLLTCITTARVSHQVPREDFHQPLLYLQSVPLASLSVTCTIRNLALCTEQHKTMEWRKEKFFNECRSNKKQGLMLARISPSHLRQLCAEQQ